MLPRASLESLRDHTHNSLLGLVEDTGAASLAAVHQGLLHPQGPTVPAQTSRPFANRRFEADGSSASAVDLSNLAFKQHASEPQSQQVQTTDSIHDDPEAGIGIWTRTLHQVGLETQSRKALGLYALGFGAVSVGARSQAQAVRTGAWGEVLLQSAAELSATAQGLGKARADHAGLTMQASSQLRLALATTSGATWRAPAAAVNLAGMRVNLTPGVTAHAGTLLGVDGGGSFFMGVTSPTPAACAAGTQLNVGLDAAGSVFVGARAEGDASVDFGGHKLGMTGGVWAGVGLEAKATCTLSQVNGQMAANVALQLGLAVGLGASMGLMTQVNVQPAVDAGRALWLWGGVGRTAARDKPVST